MGPLKSPRCEQPQCLKSPARQLHPHGCENAVLAPERGSKSDLTGREVGSPLQKRYKEGLLRVAEEIADRFCFKDRPLASAEALGGGLFA